MRLLVCTMGLPKSGKSTWAREFSKKCGCPVVNPDSIRLAIHGSRYIQEAENLVWTVAYYMTDALFLAGHELVVLDATNMRRDSRDKWQPRVWDKTVFKILSADVETCKERAAGDDVDLGLLPVIERMAAFSDNLNVYEEEVFDEDKFISEWRKS